MRKRRPLEEILYFWIVVMLTIAIITNSILLVMFWRKNGRVRSLLRLL